MVCKRLFFGLATTTCTEKCAAKRRRATYVQSTKRSRVVHEDRACDWCGELRPAPPQGCRVCSGPCPGGEPSALWGRLTVPGVAMARADRSGGEGRRARGVAFCGRSHRPHGRGTVANGQREAQTELVGGESEAEHLS